MGFSVALAAEHHLLIQFSKSPPKSGRYVLILDIYFSRAYTIPVPGTYCQPLLELQRGNVTFTTP